MWIVEQKSYRLNISAKRQGLTYGKKKLEELRLKNMTE
jgi:hypothetical protein